MLSQSLQVKHVERVHGGALEQDAADRSSVPHHRMTPEQLAAWTAESRLELLKRYTSAELFAELARRGDFKTVT